MNEIKELLDEMILSARSGEPLFVQWHDVAILDNYIKVKEQSESDQDGCFACVYESLPEDDLPCKICCNAYQNYWKNAKEAMKNL